jgi:tetratricopeptide (TPR) repeat protein
MAHDFRRLCDDAQVMADIGRNAPCPCGSGKKYKKCCLAKDEQARQRRPPAPPRPQRSSPPAWTPDDELDELSNSVDDLIKVRRFDEALAACHRLLTEFPDVDDGLDRSAEVHAAMGNHALAADFYRKALDFVTDPSRARDYDPAIAELYRTEIAKEERLAGLR